MSTAGKRVLAQKHPLEVNEIYQAIQEKLRAHFDLKYIGTMSGKAEGLYDWLTVNYLNNKLADFIKINNIIRYFCCIYANCLLNHSKK